MSLQHRRDPEQPNKARSKSQQYREKESFKEDEKSELSINIMIENTIKSANVAIANQNNFNSETFEEVGTPKRPRRNILSDSAEISKRNSDSKHEFDWEVIKIEEKRKIKGLKSKLKWFSKKEGNWIIVRAVLTENYKERLDDADYLVELDSSNFDIKLSEQKQIQTKINKIIEEQQNKAEEQRNEILHWLRSVLLGCHAMFINMKLYERPVSREYDFKRHEINNQYMLYPCPAAITWSPHGFLCLSENKVGGFNRPIVGNIHSYRSLIEAPNKFERFGRRANEIGEDLKMIDEKSQDGDQLKETELFDWDTKEEINFSVFGRSGDEEVIEDKYQNGREEGKTEKQDKRVKDHETFFMGTTNSISPKHEKIYRRYFVGFGDSEEFQFKEKLKIFTVKSQVVEMEDGILYLIDKIQKGNKNGIMESLLENEFAGYSSIYSKSDYGNKTYHKLKYELTAEFMQEKIKNTPQSQHFLYMKSILIENEFFRLALERYFEDNFKRLKIVNKIECLGTYDNFDNSKAEKLLIDLLEEHLKADRSQKEEATKKKAKYYNKPQKYDDVLYKVKKYRKMEDQIEEMKLFLKGYRKAKSKNLPALLEVDDSIESLKQDSDNQSEDGSNEVKSSLKQNESRKLNRNVNLNFLPFVVVNKLEFIPFQFNLIITPIQRKSFMEAIIPILWIKDRSSEKFEYKLAKRVIIANSKIIEFIEVLNSIGNVWKKHENKRNIFLSKIIKCYHEEKKNIEVPRGKYYIAECIICKSEFTTHSIEELLRVNMCSRCKFPHEVN